MVAKTVTCKQQNAIKLGPLRAVGASQHGEDKWPTGTRDWEGIWGPRDTSTHILVLSQKAGYSLQPINNDPYRPWVYSRLPEHLERSHGLGIFPHFGNVTALF
jgi:hypothetical protein